MYQQTEEKIWVPFRYSCTRCGSPCNLTGIKIKKDVDQGDENWRGGVDLIENLDNVEGNLAGIVYDGNRGASLFVFYNEDGSPVGGQPSIRGHEEDYQLMMEVPCYKGYTVIALGSSTGGKTTTIELTVPFETREEAEEWISREGNPSVHVVAEVKWPADY